MPWFEAITENFAGRGGLPRANLSRVRRDYPLVFHGVSLSIGSTDPISPEFLRDWKDLIREFEPLWVSDHLCWTRHAHENSYDLLPMPLTQESLRHVASRVAFVQDVIQRPILLENPSAYLEFAANEMGEADFLAELAARTGCGLLLDLNNIVVTRHNLGIDPAAYLERLTGTWVPQFHLAGHTIADGVRIDTHDHPVSDEVKALLPQALRLWPAAAPMLEWDDKIPPLAELMRHRDEIAAIVEAAALPAAHPKQHERIEISQAAAADRNKIAAPYATNQLFSDFWGIVKSPAGIRSAAELPAKLLREDCPTQALVGARVYSNAYFLRLRDTLKNLFPTLAFVADALFDHIVAEYLRTTKPASHSIDDAGFGLPEFIGRHTWNVDFGAEAPVLAALAAFEAALLEVQLAKDTEDATARLNLVWRDSWSEIGLRLAPKCKILSLEYAVHPVYESVRKGLVPVVPECERIIYMISRGEDFKAEYQLLDGFASRVSAALVEESSIFQAAESACELTKLTSEEFLPRFAGLVSQWLAAGLFMPVAGPASATTA